MEVTLAIATQAIEGGALIAAEQTQVREGVGSRARPGRGAKLQRHVQARVAEVEAETEARDSCQQRCNHHWLTQQHQLKGQHDSTGIGSAATSKANHKAKSTASWASCNKSRAHNQVHELG